MHHTNLLFEHGGLGSILAQRTLQLEQLLSALVLIVLFPLHLLLIIRYYLLSVSVFGPLSLDLALEIVDCLLHLLLDLGNLTGFEADPCAGFIFLEKQTHIFCLFLL